MVKGHNTDSGHRGEVGWGISAEPPAASKPHFAQSRVLSYIYYHSQESASVDPALTPRHCFWIPEWSSAVVDNEECVDMSPAAVISPVLRDLPARPSAV